MKSLQKTRRARVDRLEPRRLFAALSPGISVTGSLTTAIQGRNSLVTSLNDQISDWDVRLTDKRAALQKQFAALEVALGKMKDQSSWLAGQLAGLPSGGGG